MSSISFPNSSAGHLSSPHDQENSFYQSSFDAQSTSSFQMNPLSSHPPRTPRTSLAFSHSSEIPNNQREEQRSALSVDVHEVEVEVEVEEDDKREANVSREEIWREIVRSSYGRDKALKLIQYGMKLYLLFHTRFRPSHSLSKLKLSVSWDESVALRLGSTISGLSLSRKCLLLFNWLGPLTVVLAQQQSLPYSVDSPSSASQRKVKPLLYTFLHAPPPVLLELVNAVADDLYTLSLLGLLGGQTGVRARKFADWCWFSSTIVNLIENAVERGVLRDLRHEVESRSYTESMTMGATAKSNPTASKIDENELQRLHKQDRWLVVTRNKLLMDLIFVSYDCFGLKRGKGPVQVMTGLASAVLSTAKIYSREKTTLAKSSKS